MRYLRLPSLEAGIMVDRDKLLLEAAFQILKDFVEQEEPGGTIDWDYDDEYRRAWAEIQDLYDWWVNRRPRREDPNVLLPKHVPIERMFRPMTDAEIDELATQGLHSHGVILAPPEEYERLMRELEPKLLAMENAYFEEDQRNLHRLIDIRPYLWT